MDVLVMGGTGTVGRPLVSLLRARGASVRVGTREPGRHKGGVDFGLDRPETWAGALAGVRRVFLMMPSGVRAPDALVTTLVPVLEKAGVERVVNLSGYGVERTSSPMRCSELALERSALAVTHLRPNFFMQNFCAGALRDGICARGEIAVAAGEARISFVDARDIAAVAAEALARDVGAAVDLTGPAAVTHADLAEALARASRRPVHYRPLSDAAAREALAQEGLSAGRIDARLAFLAVARAGGLAAVSGDIERVLGRPPSSLNAFAQDHASIWSES